MADVAVLLSGGLDSAVLVAQAAVTAEVQPVYVSAGLWWEAEELAAVERLLGAASCGSRLAPLVRLVADVRDVLPASHWALRGAPPAYDTPDQDVYVPGRNVVLLVKAALYCATRGISRIMMGPLAGNPFPDATPEFFGAMAHALSLGLGCRLVIETPFAAMHKEEVIRVGAALGVRFGLTMSCMKPSAGRHCGLCSKCRERRDAFAAARVVDPTSYAAPAPR